jgi:chaperonin GroES
VGVSNLGTVTDGLPIKMLHDRVLVKEPRDEGERRSSGGILIPATAQVAKRLIWGEVLAVGNHVRAVEVGDRVLFSPDDHHEVEIAGDEYLLLRERDLHAVAAPRNDANTGLYL